MSGRAKQACTSCKKGKRGCDKALPACGLCLRLSRECVYETTTEAFTPEAFASLAQKVAELEAQVVVASFGQQAFDDGALLPDASALAPPDAGDQGQHARPDLISFRLPRQNFPPLYFLDSALFKYGHFEVEKPFVKTPQEILAALGSSDDLRTAIDDYFNDTHQWICIVSRTRLLESLQGGFEAIGADTALLLMAMKMIGTRPDASAGAHGHVYQLTKSFVWYTESQNAYSLQLLQASVLLAIFELGNAIYPGAFLTIGFCARLATAMGVHDKTAPQLLPPPTRWTEQEERRRVWWAIVVVDRIVSIGKRGHPLVTTVSVEAILPVDDASWTHGEAAPAQPLGITANTTIHTSPFARLCQASHILGRVLEHLNDRTMSDAFRVDEARSLHAVARSFTLVVTFPLTSSSTYRTRAENGGGSTSTGLAMDDLVAYGPSLAVTLSALAQLFERYGCPDSLPDNASEGYVALQQLAIIGTAEVCELTYEFAERMLAHFDGDGDGGGGRGSRLDGIGPFVLDALYQCCANYLWYVMERGDETKRVKSERVLRLLRLLDTRWKAAGEYVRITQQFERLGTARRHEMQ